MKVGMIGAGKLGLPVSLAIESRGHEVTVFDVNPAASNYIADRQIPYTEEGLQPLLDATKIKVAQSIGEVVAGSDIVFCAVQTPHDPEYEGATRLPEDRKDFDYTFLKQAIGEVATQSQLQARKTTLAVISTCLPGTFEREIRPLLNDNVDYVYTPQFIAMGTVLNDYLDPEFNLLGVESDQAADKLEQFYWSINDAPVLRTDVTSAEAIKVSYNTFITMKTVLGNTWGELCHKLGANVDDVFRAWSLSNRRLLSPKYLRPGMSDGGGCHPRDNIALSYIAEKTGLSHNIFEDLMRAREDFEAWHADLARDMAETNDLPLVILGRSFKPETNIETGSPALLMANILREKGVEFEHLEDGLRGRAVYFIATQHDRYRGYKFPRGSIVIDPFRYLDERKGVRLVKIGAN